MITKFNLFEQEENDFDIYIDESDKNNIDFIIAGYNFVYYKPNDEGLVTSGHIKYYDYKIGNIEHYTKYKLNDYYKSNKENVLGIIECLNDLEGRVEISPEYFIALAVFEEIPEVKKLKKVTDFNL